MINYDWFYVITTNFCITAFLPVEGGLTQVWGVIVQGNEKKHWVLKSGGVARKIGRCNTMDMPGLLCLEQKTIQNLQMKKGEVGDLRGGGRQRCLVLKKRV